MYPQAALITLLTVLLISVAMYLVGKARARHGIEAPATTGNPEFERVFRAHQNTLEATVNCHEVVGGTAVSRVHEALAAQEARLSVAMGQMDGNT